MCAFFKCSIGRTLCFSFLSIVSGLVRRLRPALLQGSSCGGMEKNPHHDLIYMALPGNRWGYPINESVLFFSPVSPLRKRLAGRCDVANRLLVILSQEGDTRGLGS